MAATPSILIIDDEEEMCWALEKALREERYTTISAQNGPDGLAAVAGQEIDLVLLDIRMPGVDGLTVLGQIQKLKPGLPVLIMTGYSSLPIALEAIQRGATGYLTKPISLPDLKAAVEKALSPGAYPPEIHPADS